MRSFILAYAVPAWQDIPETLTVVLTNKVKTNSRYFVGVFSKTITLLALVGYEIIIGGSEWGGPFVGCRLKFSYFVGSRLKFSIFVGSRFNFLILLVVRKSQLISKNAC